MMLPMMLPVWDLRIARQRPLEARVSIARVKTFPEARCRRPPLRTAIAKVPESKPIDPPRMCRIKSGSRMLTHPFGTYDRDSTVERGYELCGCEVPELVKRFRAKTPTLHSPL